MSTAEYLDTDEKIARTVVRERKQGTSKTFDDIKRNMKEKRTRCVTLEGHSLAMDKSRRLDTIEKAGKCSGRSSIASISPVVKTKHEFPAAKYHDELVALQAKLDLVTSLRLIETYGIPARHRSMHSRLKSLKARTKSLMAELNNRERFYAVANRLISGDGLDSNLGRLDRDVMWFIAELKYRQMDSMSSATLVE